EKSASDQSSFLPDKLNLGLVVAAPVVISATGFTSVGIAAGSIAANLMSATAIANGGAVAVGSLVAITQSI
ncbi:interferon alpha-inducible protein 27-like protein 2A, partial [Clarias magur]